MNTIAQVLKGNIDTEVKRAKMSIGRLLLFGIMAGMFIALGASASSVAMHSTAGVGLSRFIGGCIFPIGLMLIVFLGGELFTGDCLIILGIFDKKVRVLSALKVLVLVWAANLVGAVVIALLVFASGQLGYTNGLLGAFTIKVALGKATMSFGSAFTSGILCNIFVCGAVLMASAAKDAGGKIWAMFFPIMAFVVSGYEHCVANMYYIPAGIIAKNNSVYAEKAMEVYGYTEEQLAKLNWKSFFIDSSMLSMTLLSFGILFLLTVLLSKSALFIMINLLL